MCTRKCAIVFFFYDTATTEMYTYVHTLSLRDALPISNCACSAISWRFVFSDDTCSRDRKSTRLKPSHQCPSLMPSSAGKKNFTFLRTLRLNFIIVLLTNFHETLLYSTTTSFPSQFFIS